MAASRPDTKFMLRMLAAFAATICGSSVLAQELFTQQMTIMVDGNPRVAYFESNHDLTQSGTTINRVVVMVHGSSRTNVTYERMLDAATANGVASQTLLFAPQFLVDDDIAANALPDDVLFWPNGWRQGHLSTDNGLGRISSFALVDNIVTDFVTNNPSVENVVIIGHSAGGQYAQRFAAASRLEQTLQGINADITVRYVPANPSSTVYMDARRRVDGTIDTFAEPDASNCPDYDEYKYGLSSRLNNYLVTIGGRDQVLQQYPQRNVRYLLGENDNNANSSSLDTSCEGNLQGRQRLERGTVFYNYIREVFDESAHDTHQMAVSPNIGHSSSIFTQPCGLSFIFDIGSCGFITPTKLNAVVNATSDEVTLTWVDLADDEGGYEVLRSDDAGDTYRVLETLAENTTSAADTTAMRGMQYRYRVRAVTGNDRSGPSNTAIINASAAPPPPPAPPAPPPPAPGNSGGGGSAGLLALLLVLFAGLWVGRSR